jgi:hypothetical protein
LGGHGRQHPRPRPVEPVRLRLVRPDRLDFLAEAQQGYLQAAIGCIVAHIEDVDDELAALAGVRGQREGSGPAGLHGLDHPERVGRKLCGHLHARP